MRKTIYPNDSRLWSLLMGEFQAAGAGTEAAARHARRAVASVRNERDQDGIVSWAPGDQIPAAVVWVYDLDGDVWTRKPGGLWKMEGFDPDDVEELAGVEHDDTSLLDNYGPVTGAYEGGSGPAADPTNLAAVERN